jgi:LytS/YehU family sensor histidine kinase
MLNSLVENAVKHGVEPAAAGGTIELTAQQIGGQLEVIVTDTGIGLNAKPATIGSGVGVANLRERLAALFGERGRFALEPLAPKGTRALISVPFQSGA